MLPRPWFVSQFSMPSIYALIWIETAHRFAVSNTNTSAASCLDGPWCSVRFGFPLRNTKTNRTCTRKLPAPGTLKRDTLVVVSLPECPQIGPGLSGVVRSSFQNFREGCGGLQGVFRAEIEQRHVLGGLPFKINHEILSCGCLPPPMAAWEVATSKDALGSSQEPPLPAVSIGFRGGPGPFESGILP